MSPWFTELSANQYTFVVRSWIPAYVELVDSKSDVIIILPGEVLNPVKFKTALVERGVPRRCTSV